MGGLGAGLQARARARRSFAFSRTLLRRRRCRDDAAAAAARQSSAPPTHTLTSSPSKHRSLPSFAFAFFTFCNLAPRGATHHAWYRAKFDDYPPSRKAVIPFVW